MRRGAVTVLAGVLASAGCERVFDVDSREFVDAPVISPGPAIRLIQTTSHAWDHTHPPIPLAFDNDVQQGDLLVVIVAVFDATSGGVTDSSLDDYVLSAMDSTPDHATVLLYYATAKATGPLIVTIDTATTNTSMAETSVILDDYRGAGANPFDTSTHTFGTGLGDPNTIDVGPLIAAVDNELLVTALAHDAFVAEAIAAPFQVEAIATDDNGVTVPLVSADATVSAGAVEATWTMTDRSGWAGVMVAFKPQ